MKKIDTKSISNEKLIKILFHEGLVASKADGHSRTRQELIEIYNLNRKKKK
jgi:hypothetical protein